MSDDDREPCRSPADPRGHGPRGTAREAAAGRRQDRDRSAQAKTVEAQDLNLYYGDFHAVQDVNVTIEPNKVTALIGSSGCGKSTFLRSLNRMHELIAGRPRRGRGPARRRGHLRPRRRPGARAPPGRHGLPGAEPVPDDVDLRQRRRRPEAQRPQDEEGRHGRDRRALAARRAPLGRGQGPPRQARHRACPAASSSASASPARSRSSPRCC